MSNRKIKIFRAVTNITQAELARKLGCTQALVSMLENGRANLSPKMREKLPEVLDIPAAVLFNGEEKN